MWEVILNLLFDSTRGDGFGSLDLWWVYFEDVQGYPLAKLSDHGG